MGSPIGSDYLGPDYLNVWGSMRALRPDPLGYAGIQSALDATDQRIDNTAGLRGARERHDIGGGTGTRGLTYQLTYDRLGRTNEPSTLGRLLDFRG